MKTVFRRSFTRDLRGIKDRRILSKIQAAIENVEAAGKPDEITNLKKLTFGNNYYRIRVGDYRIGIVIESADVEFVRCLHRRDLYRFFP